MEGEVFQGALGTTLPNKIRLRASSGMVDIAYDDIKSIEFFRDPNGTNFRFASRNGYGVGMSLLTMPFSSIRGSLPSQFGSSISLLALHGAMEFSLSEDVFARISAGYGARQFEVFTAFSVNLFRVSGDLNIRFSDQDLAPFGALGAGIAIGNVESSVGVSFAEIEVHAGGGARFEFGPLSLFGQGQLVFLPIPLVSGQGLSSGFTIDFGVNLHL